MKGEWDIKGRFCTENSKVIKFPEQNNDAKNETEDNKNE